MLLKREVGMRAFLGVFFCCSLWGFAAAMEGESDRRVEDVTSLQRSEVPVLDEREVEELVAIVAALAIDGEPSFRAVDAGLFVGPEQPPAAQQEGEVEECGLCFLPYDGGGRLKVDVPCNVQNVEAHAHAACFACLNAWFVVAGHENCPTCDTPIHGNFNEVLKMGVPGLKLWGALRHWSWCKAAGLAGDDIDQCCEELSCYVGPFDEIPVNQELPPLLSFRQRVDLVRLFLTYCRDDSSNSCTALRVCANALRGAAQAHSFMRDDACQLVKCTVEFALWCRVEGHDEVVFSELFGDFMHFLGLYLAAVHREHRGHVLSCMASSINENRALWAQRRFLHCTWERIEPFISRLSALFNNPESRIEILGILSHLVSLPGIVWPQATVEPLLIDAVNLLQRKAARAGDAALCSAALRFITAVLSERDYAFQPELLSRLLGLVGLLQSDEGRVAGVELFQALADRRHDYLVGNEALIYQALSIVSAEHGPSKLGLPNPNAGRMLQLMREGNLLVDVDFIKDAGRAAIDAFAAGYDGDLIVREMIAYDESLEHVQAVLNFFLDYLASEGPRASECLCALRDVLRYVPAERYEQIDCALRSRLILVSFNKLLASGDRESDLIFNGTMLLRAIPDYPSQLARFVWESFMDARLKCVIDVCRSCSQGSGYTANIADLLYKLARNWNEGASCITIRICEKIKLARGMDNAELMKLLTEFLGRDLTFSKAAFQLARECVDQFSDEQYGRQVSAVACRLKKKLGNGCVLL